MRQNKDKKYASQKLITRELSGDFLANQIPLSYMAIIKDYDTGK